MIRVTAPELQQGAERFERRDPQPFVPFAFDDAGSLPTLPEVLGWIALGGSVITLCALFLGVA